MIVSDKIRILCHLRDGQPAYLRETGNSQSPGRLFCAKNKIVGSV